MPAAPQAGFTTRAVGSEAEMRQTLAGLPALQRINPALAARWKDHGFTAYGPGDGSMQAGQGLRRAVGAPWMRDLGYGFSQVFNHPVGGTLAGAGMGGILGLVLGALLRRPGMGAALGGLAGAGLGGLAGHWRGQAGQKRAFAEGESDPWPYLRRRLLADTSLSPDTKGTLLEAVAQLGMADLDRLRDLLMVAAGAGAGAIVARFLAGAGLLGTAAGALGGAWIGGRISAALRPSTLAGQTRGVSRDLYGNRFLF